MKKFIKKIISYIFLKLPSNKFFDKFIGYINFYRGHFRLPSRNLLLNDVFFHIKISDKIIDPLRVFTSDKHLVKIFIQSVVGNKYNVPTIQILNSIREIDSFYFPESCCIKPTHASGLYIIRRDNACLDLNEIKDWLEVDYHRVSRERNYKDLIPKIIVEPIIYNSSNIQDYKFFCSNGEPKFIQVDSDRLENHTRCFFDPSWNKLNFSISYPITEHDIARPNCLDEMLTVSKKIAGFFDYVRVDFYTDGTSCMIGEITHCPESSNGRFIPLESEIDASNLFFS